MSAEAWVGFEFLEPRLLLSGSIAVTVDALATSDTTPELTGTVDDPAAAVEVTVNGAAYDAANDGFGKWTLADDTLPALAEGTYNVLAFAVNAEKGTAGSDDTANELTIDATAPTVTVSSLVTADKTPSLSGTVNESDATVWVTVNGSAHQATNNRNGTWTLADNIVAALDYGTYDVTAAAFDAAGNEATDATTDELTVVRQLPISVTIDPLVTSDTTPELTGTVSLGSAIVQVAVRGTTYTATNNGDGTWTLADNTVAALPEGTYSVLVTASDPDSDAEAQDTTANELTIDLTAPVVTVSALKTADQTPQLTGTVSEPGAVVWVTVDGQTYRATNNGNGTWTLPNNTVDELDYGTYDVAVTAADAAENSGTDATTNELTIRAELAVSVDKLVTNDTSPALTGTVSDPDAEVAVTVGGATYDATNNGDGTWTLPDGTIGPLAEGNYEVLAVAQNTQKGSYASDNVRQDLVIDVTPPAVTITALTTDDTTPELNGTVDDDAVTIIVTVNGRDYAAHHNYDAGEPDGTWTLNDNVISPLPGGTYDVVVTATDAAENEGTDTTTDELTINSDVILVTIDELATTDTTPELTGLVGDPAADVQVTVDGKVYAATNNADGTWTLADGTLDPLAEGVYDVVVEANNSGAGTSGNDDTTDELTVDTTVPVVTITRLTTTDRTPGLTGTISESDCTISVNVDGNDYEVSNNDDGTWTLNFGATWTLDNNTVLELGYGTYNVAVTATDAAGNVGTDSTTNELIVQPELDVTVDELVTNDSTPELTGTVEDPDAAITVTVKGTAYAAVNNGDGTWTLADGIVAALTSGVYDVRVLAVNSTFGTADYDDTTNELTVDLTTPVVTVNRLTTGDKTPALSGTVTEPGAKIVVTLDGNVYQATNNGNGTWTLPDNAIPLFHGAPVKLDYGTYNVAVTATDKAGNAGSDTTTNELIIQRTLAVGIDPLVTNDTRPELTGTVSNPAATVRVTVKGATYTATNNGDGTWTLPDNTVASLEPVFPAKEVTYDVSVVAVDAGSGATGQDTTTNELTIDLAAPAVTVTRLDTDDTTPALSGTVSEALASVWVTVNGKTYPATNNGDGTWTVANNRISELAHGTYDVAVTATDPAGNAGTDKTLNELTIRVAPQVSVDKLRTNDTTPELTGRVDDHTATIVVRVDGANYNAVNNGDGTWTLPDNTVAALNDGTYDVVVTATNAQGNNATDTTANELTIETVPPEVTLENIDGTDLGDAGGTVTTSDTTPGFRGTLTDSNPAEAEIVLTVNGTDYNATFTGYELNDNGKWEAWWEVKDGDITPLPAGTYDVTVTVTDEAGNTTTETLTGALTITNVPTVSVDRLTTDDRTPSLTGKVGTPAAVVVVTVNGTAYNAINNGDGTWRVPNNIIAPLAPGTYDVAVTATSAGLVGRDATTGELVIIDERIITIDPLITSYVSPGLTGTVNDPNAVVEVQVNGRVYEAHNNGDGTWTLDEDTITPLALGTYDVAVRASHSDGTFTFDVTSDELIVVSTTQQTIVVTLADKGKLKYKDPDGTNVEIQLKGKKGSATFTFVSNSPISLKGDKLKADAGAKLVSMVVNADTDQITFKAGGGADDRATIGFIGGNAALGKLQAGDCGLIDGGIYMPNGIIEQIDLRSIQETNVTMGGTSSKGVKMQVAENTEEANIRITMTDVKSFGTGSMINASLLVGTLVEDSNGDGVNDLPELIDLFNDFEIKSFRITGYKGAPADLYVNANIAASEIGKVALINTTLRNLDDDSEEHVPFGITTDSLKKLTLNQGGIKYTWPDTWLATPQDLKVRVG
ncbi:MAG: Ig-like domain-containing protein [Planctomycetota bacterium]